MKPTKLLILDDNAPFAESLGDVLTREGFETKWAAGAVLARKQAAEFRPEILIVDVNLVTSSGIDFAQEILRGKLVNGVIFLTGRIEMDHQQIPAELRAISVLLHKPVEKQDLLEAIQKLRQVSGRVEAMQAQRQR